MILREQLLDAMLDGKLGHGLVVTRQEALKYFSNENPASIGVLLSNSEIDTAVHSPTWTKFTQRIGDATYRVHPSALAARLEERGGK